MQEPNMLDEREPQEGEIVVLITDDQKAMVMNELNKLFLFHGKRMSDAERGMFASELCSANIPYKAILGGLRELQEEKDESRSKNVTTFWAIKEACRRHVVSEYKSVSCKHCAGVGFVTMIRADTEFKGYRYSFACTCPNGDRQINSFPKMARWNGTARQEMVDRSGGGRSFVNFVYWDRNAARPVID